MDTVQLLENSCLLLTCLRGNEHFHFSVTEYKVFLTTAVLKALCAFEF